jgi:hypothetical protein
MSVEPKVMKCVGLLFSVRLVEPGILGGHSPFYRLSGIRIPVSTE